eukprot:g39310.t1
MDDQRPLVFPNENTTPVYKATEPDTSANIQDNEQKAKDQPLSSFIQALLHILMFHLSHLSLFSQLSNFPKALIFAVYDCVGILEKEKRLHNTRVFGVGKLEETGNG